MAENRTFKFYGVGYSATPVTVTATMGGQQVFSGTVPTVNQPIDPYPYPTPSEAETTELFSIVNFSDLNTDFAGNIPMSLTVNSGSGVLITNIKSNWQGQQIYNETGDIESEVLGTATDFDFTYNGEPTNSEGSPDPRSNVFINGVQQVPDILSIPRGVYTWRVLTDQTISYNLNVNIGKVGNTVGNTVNYTGPYTPVPNYPPA